jgi:hypothetical protein
MRPQALMAIYTVVAALIVASVFVEHPGTTEAIGLAVVFVVMLVCAAREWKRFQRSKVQP